MLKKIESAEGSLLNFARSYKFRGIYKTENNTYIYREWAPGAKEVYLTGDFCNWDKHKYKLERD